MTGRARRLAAVAIALLATGAARMPARPAGPETALHYAPNANFTPSGAYGPGAAGFNLADVSSPRQLALLPAGVRALVWVGQCGGATERFVRAVRPYLNHPKVFGFYLMDQPDPRAWLTAPGLRRPCTERRLNAEADWIRARAPRARTFIVIMNLGSPHHPAFTDHDDLRLLRVDLVGVDPYPCRSELHGCDARIIDRYVAAAKAAGIPAGHIVPIYQSFGGGHWRDGSGGTYAVPSPKQERRILARWAALAPHPAFDYAYSWGSQRADDALADRPALRAVFAVHNAAPAAAKSRP